MDERPIKASADACVEASMIEYGQATVVARVAV